MARIGFWFEAVVKDDERAFLLRDGRFERLLEPGRFSTFDPLHKLSAEVVKVVRAEITAERARLLQKTQPELAAEHFTIVQAGPSVNDSAYMLGLSNADPARIVLAKRPLELGLEDAPRGEAGVLARSVDTFGIGEWVHMKLEVIVQPSGDVTIGARRNNIDVQWYRNDGNPVAIFRLQADRRDPGIQLQELELKQGSVFLKGRSLDPTLRGLPDIPFNLGKTASK